MRRPDRIALLLAAVAGVAVLAAGGEGAALAPAAGDSHQALPPPGAVPGMIAVADHDNDRIQVFYPDGTFAFRFRGDSQPQDIAVGPDGRIVVAYEYSDAVHVFNPNGSFAFRLGTGGSALGQIGNAYGLAVGPDGRIVVGEYSRVQVFNPDGSFALAFGSRERGGDRLLRVRDNLSTWSGQQVRFC